jgi:hypothetical protein
LNAWESDRCRRSGRSIGSLSGKGFWSNLLTIVAPPLTRRCNPLNPLRSISWTWWDRAISKAKNVSTACISLMALSMQCRSQQA